MAGLIGADDDRAHFSSTYLENLALAAERAAALDITMLIEPINLRSIPGYFLNYQRDGRRIIEQVGASNLKLQFDCFHCQIMEGDLAMHLRELIGVIGRPTRASAVPEDPPPSQPRGSGSATNAAARSATATSTKCWRWLRRSRARAGPIPSPGNHPVERLHRDEPAPAADCRHHRRLRRRVAGGGRRCPGDGPRPARARGTPGGCGSRRHAIRPPHAPRRDLRRRLDHRPRLALGSRAHRGRVGCRAGRAAPQGRGGRGPGRPARGADGGAREARAESLHDHPGRTLLGRARRRIGLGWGFSRRCPGPRAAGGRPRASRRGGRRAAAPA